jgi:hypothetical protein
MRKFAMAAWLMATMVSAGGAAAADEGRIQHRATEFDRWQDSAVHAGMPKAGGGAAKAELNLSFTNCPRARWSSRRLFWRWSACVSACSRFANRCA